MPDTAGDNPFTCLTRLLRFHLVKCTISGKDRPLYSLLVHGGQQVDVGETDQPAGGELIEVH